MSLVSSDDGTPVRRFVCPHHLRAQTRTTRRERETERGRKTQKESRGGGEWQAKNNGINGPPRLSQQPTCISLALPHSCFYAVPPSPDRSLSPSLASSLPLSSTQNSYLSSVKGRCRGERGGGTPCAPYIVHAPYKSAEVSLFYLSLKECSLLLSLPPSLSLSPLFFFSLSFSVQFQIQNRIGSIVKRSGVFFFSSLVSLFPCYSPPPLFLPVSVPPPCLLPCPYAGVSLPAIQ